METPLEQILTQSRKADMISYMSTHPESFGELLELAMTDKQPYSWRASWLLWSCMEKNDKRIQPYIQTILDILPHRKDNQKRELLKILQQMEIDEDQEGLLFDYCVSLWEQINKKPSIRYIAFQIISSIALRYPELSDEIALLARDHYMESLSPGIKRGVAERIKKIRS